MENLKDNEFQINEDGKEEKVGLGEKIKQGAINFKDKVKDTFRMSKDKDQQ